MGYDDYNGYEDENLGVIRADGDDWITTWTGDGQPILTHDPALPMLGSPTVNTPANPAPDDLGTTADGTPLASLNTNTVRSTTTQRDEGEDEGFDTQTVLIGAGLIVGVLWLLKK